MSDNPQPGSQPEPLQPGYGHSLDEQYVVLYGRPILKRQRTRMIVVVVILGLGAFVLLAIAVIGKIILFSQ